VVETGGTARVHRSRSAGATRSASPETSRCCERDYAQSAAAWAMAVHFPLWQVGAWPVQQGY
jgi:hypothetical protein